MLLVIYAPVNLSAIGNITDPYMVTKQDPLEDPFAGWLRDDSGGAPAVHDGYGGAETGGWLVDWCINKQQS